MKGFIGNRQERLLAMQIGYATDLQDKQSFETSLQFVKVVQSFLKMERISKK